MPQGVSDLYLNNTIKLLDLETTLFGATFLALSLVTCISRVLANFVFENHRLVTMITRVGRREISTTVLNCLTPKTPLWRKHLSSIFKDARVIAVRSYHRP